MKTISQEPPEIESWLNEVYRFGNFDQINWDAKRRINPKIYTREILPSMYSFIEEKLEKITGDAKQMNALIGLSGGLDSTVAAYIAARAMQQAIVSGKRKKAKLALLNFTRFEEHDTEEIARHLQSQNDSVRIEYVETDISPITTTLARTTSDLVAKLDEKPLDFPGEILTRTLCSLVNEVGARTGYASIDTTNGTEFILGEFSVGSGYDLSLLTDLYKTDVFEIGKILGIPDPVLNAHPRNSAFGKKTKPELYFGKLPGGISAKNVFEVLDPILYWLFEREKNPEEIASALGHDREVIEKIKKRIDNQKHRRVSPNFCIESHSIDFENNTNMTDEQSKNKIEETMLAENFR